jgi:3-dehydroquinate dehydratase
MRCIDHQAVDAQLGAEARDIGPSVTTSSRTSAAVDASALICNFGALSHTSYALHDALLAAERPAVEVHISDIAAREPWRRTSVTAPATRHQVIGHGWRGYLEAVDWLLDAARS